MVWYQTQTSKYFWDMKGKWIWLRATNNDANKSLFKNGIEALLIFLWMSWWWWWWWLWLGEVYSELVPDHVDKRNTLKILGEIFQDVADTENKILSIELVDQYNTQWHTTWQSLVKNCGLCNTTYELFFVCWVALGLYGDHLKMLLFLVSNICLLLQYYVIFKQTGRQVIVV